MKKADIKNLSAGDIKNQLAALKALHENEISAQN